LIATNDILLKLNCCIGKSEEHGHGEGAFIRHRIVSYQ